MDNQRKIKNKKQIKSAHLVIWMKGLGVCQKEHLIFQNNFSVFKHVNALIREMDLD